MADVSVNLLLPPGFLFSPTDEELVLHFLYCKASLIPCHPNIIPDLDPSLLHPCQLNGKALSSGNEYYFFTKVKEKRSTENGYWKEIGITKPIFSGDGQKVGMKNYLVYQIVGEQGGDDSSSWVMQEYHICSSSSDWVLCRVYEKKQGAFNCDSDDEDGDCGSELSWLDEVYLSLDDHDMMEGLNMPAD